MLEDLDKRLFGLPPGVDFPAALIAGLEHRLRGAPPEDWANVTLILNTRRMARRLREIFDAGPARLLPRMVLVTDLSPLLPGQALPAARSGLRRRLDLMALVRKLVAQEPHLAQQGSLFDLTDTLASLLDEMEAEGVSPEVVAGLDVTDESGHWARTQAFIDIARQYLDALGAEQDAQARARAIVAQVITAWDAAPPAGPVILAGSTGSRRSGLELMQAVLTLPRGAVVLPGFDFDLPDAGWDAMASEDHPQYRFAALGQGRPDVTPWHDTPAPAPLRNAIVSLSLRPAPATDAWLEEAPALADVSAALDGVTLIQAESSREEAQVIALRLRQAAEDGVHAALISPDRMLTRQVTAALGQWGIVPDDSAGTPLHLTPPGRFLRHIAQLFVQRLDAGSLLTLLKHPLTASTEDRGTHQRHTRALEMAIRRRGLPYPDRDGLRRLAQDDTWANWVADLLCDRFSADQHSLRHWCEAHMRIADGLAAGLPGLGGQLWLQLAGIKAREVMDSLLAAADDDTLLGGRDYVDLVGGLLSAEPVRDRDAPHPGVMIWGTIEARVQGADLVILGGMNDGSWPAPPAPDPWLNRSMRKSAGLLLPERRIGLSAHDYQQAVAAPDVWITRSVRTDGAETIPSRWLNRLQNLLGGVPAQGGQTALDAALNQGKSWLAAVHAREAITLVPSAARPSPRPPIAARPRSLRVTEIKTLKRDPYALYARHCLRLKPLGPITQTPDALLRGTVLHDVMEAFVKQVIAAPDTLTAAHLQDTAQAILADKVPWPTAQHLWQARLDRIAPWFLAREAARQAHLVRAVFETHAAGEMHLPQLGMTLTGRADRIDIGQDGRGTIYDYKTGTPPSAKEQTHFDKQLLIEALMLEQGNLGQLGPVSAAAAIYIGLGSTPKEIAAPLDEEPPAKVMADLVSLLGAYLDPNQGYTARRAARSERDEGDYDQLARFGEWDITATPVPEDVT
ncbi:MAG: double-strand break repair protein AddB [Pseudomonadota bacterium]